MDQLDAGVLLGTASLVSKWMHGLEECCHVLGELLVTAFPSAVVGPPMISSNPWKGGARGFLSTAVSS